MTKKLLQGNIAAAESALANGLEFGAFYPITPSSETMEHLVIKMHPLKAICSFSELETINLLYGAGATGVRNMTATSGCGFSLMREGLSYMVGANVPSVIYLVMRFSPGLGGLTPSNEDISIVWGVGGHGQSKCPVFTPSTVQEIADCIRWSFDVADTLRMPVIVAVDAVLGQMYELCEIKKSEFTITNKDWAIGANRNNVISSRRTVGSYQSYDDEQIKQIKHVLEREQNMQYVCKTLCEYQYHYNENKDGIYITGIGTTGRVVQEVAEQKGYGYIVPIILNPMYKINGVKKLYVVEVGGTQLRDIMSANYRDAEIVSIVYENAIPNEEDLIRRIV